MEESSLPSAAPLPPQRPWRRALLAMLISAVIFALALLAGTMATQLYSGASGIVGPRDFRPAEIEAQGAAQLSIFLLAMQATILALAIPAARTALAGAEPLLPLHWPQRGVRTIAFSILALLTLAGLGGALVYALDRSAFATDMKPFADMARTNAKWLLFLAAALGAPLAEETLFRGLIYGSLRETPLGKPGAALVSAAVWSALHANYSVYGVVLIIMIGLYFAFLREKTGSLVPSIFCHAVYNGGIVLALIATPENAF